jgi:peptidoglycan/LPS O-acetylase OafA/YrhL
MLDLIRALSAQAVLFGHCISFLGIFPWLQPPSAPYMQNLGVVVFFLLSGLLIPYTVVGNLARGGYSWRHFFIDRFARIYSGYIPGLLFIFLIDFISIKISPNDYDYYNAWGWGTFIANLFMLQDNPLMVWASQSSHALISWIPSFTSFGSGRPLWTLAIEWWIYLFFGWIALGTNTFTKNPVRFLFALAFFACIPVYNSVGGRGNGLMWVWLTGVVIFEALRKGPLPNIWFRFSIPISGFFILLAAWRFRVTRQEYDLILGLLLACGLFFIITWSQSTRFSFPVIFQKTIRIAAGYSLTLYLVHYSIAVFLLPHLDSISPVAALVAIVFFSNLVALFIALPTEMQHRKLALKLRSVFA